MGAGSWALSACGGTSADPAGSTGGTAMQAGSSGSTQTQAGTTGAGGSAQAGASGSGTSGSTSSAGMSGSATTGGGGAGGASNGGASTGGSTTGGNGGSGGSVDPSKLDKFSFFVTSLAAMRRLSKSNDGFGGDLKYGTADGLTGADKICTEIAESSMPGASAKQWHAFLSTVKGPVNAKDRIGPGPWYSRTGVLIAQNLTDLLKDRPNSPDAATKGDLPNESGIGNHRPNPNAPEDDNHHTLTGSNDKGTLYSQSATCMDWTTTSKMNAANQAGRPRIGFSWQTGGRTNWISGQDEGGCGAGVTGEGTENGGSDPSNPIVGSGGGYGGIYCFAMVP